MRNNEKKLNHEIKQLSKQEQRMTSGGYAPIEPPIDLLGDDNHIPSSKKVTKEDFRCY